MRSIKELLQVMLDNQHLFRNGLCLWNYNLEGARRITLDECDKLEEYIEHNRPSMWSSVQAFTHRNDRFYWERGNINPRIKWLQYHIKKNSTNPN